MGSLYKGLKRIVWSVLLLAFAVSTPMPAAQAQETGNKVVRVGWYESTFCYRDKFGRRRGLDYEYQHKIAAYTGWTYEYVEDSWSNLLQKLKAGEIDLLSDVSFTAERANSMFYPELPMGSEAYYIFIDANNKAISADNLSFFNGKKIGVNQGSGMSKHDNDNCVAPVFERADQNMYVNKSNLKAAKENGIVI